MSKLTAVPILSIEILEKQLQSSDLFEILLCLNPADPVTKDRIKTIPVFSNTVV